MALIKWGIHWQVPFKSFDENDYVVNIYDKGYTGDIVTLTGAAEPFTTQEDSDPDIFTPIRKQTGYLRVIDESGNAALLEEIIPENNTQRAVRLMKGDEVMWQGFLVAQAYTQPWDSNKNQLEFPVKSMLAATEDIYMPASAAGSIMPLGVIGSQAVRKLTGGDTSFFGSDYYMNDLYDPDTFDDYYINFSSFFSKETITNECSTTSYLKGISYYDALSALCSLYGLTLRERGADWYWVQYDSTGRIHYINGDDEDDTGAIKQTQLLKKLDFKATNNTETFNQGKHEVVLTLGLGDVPSIEMPAVDETSDTLLTYTPTAGDTGTVYVQPHEPTSSSNASYYFMELNYSVVGSKDTFANVGSSTYAKCLANCAMNNPYFDGHYSTDSDQNTHTGAFPCRWYQQDENSQDRLSDGLFLQLEYFNNIRNSKSGDSYADTISPSLVFRISSGTVISLIAGQYLNIKATLHNFYVHSHQLHSDNMLLYFGQTVTYLYCQLRVGNNYWDGSEWSTSASGFWIKFDEDSGNVDSNYEDSMKAESKDGWFVPITSKMQGIIYFGIYNYFQLDRGGANNQNVWQWGHSVIMTDFSLDIIAKNSLVVSGRSSNVYRDTAIEEGSMSDESVSLTIGTHNNNIYSPVFITDKNGKYIESVLYRILEDSESGGTYDPTTGTGTVVADSVSERPERHLLARMKEYFSKLRRAYSATVADGLDLMLTVYTYRDRIFVGIDAQHNWRDDTQNLKFLEVKDSVYSYAQDPDTKSTSDDPDTPVTPDEPDIPDTPDVPEDPDDIIDGSVACTSIYLADSFQARPKLCAYTGTMFFRAKREYIENNDVANLRTTATNVYIITNQITAIDDTTFKLPYGGYANFSVVGWGSFSDHNVYITGIDGKLTKDGANYTISGGYFKIQLRDSIATHAKSNTGDDSESSSSPDGSSTDNSSESETITK